MTQAFGIVVHQHRTKLREVLFGCVWDLAQYLEEIDNVVLVEERVNGDQRLSVHTWRAKTNVPLLLAPHLDSDHFAWTAVVEWAQHNFKSRWRLEPLVLRDAIFATATVELEKALGGRSTRVAIELDIQGLDGRRGVETIAYQIVSMNWRKLIEAAVRYLEDELVSGPAT